MGVSLKTNRTGRKISRYGQGQTDRRAVTIGFVITLDGGVLAVEIVRTSRQEVLDKAALRAVRDAVLFPKPPKRLFS